MPQSVQMVSLEGNSYHKQTVNDGVNEYLLELMEIRKKLELSVQLKNGDESSTSLSAPFNVCEFMI